MQPENLHVPVLLNEAIDALNIKADGCYVDATFGRGGHSEKIMSALGEQGRLVAIDQDSAAIDVANKKFSDENRFSIYKHNFVQLEQLMINLDLHGKVDGLLLDLGVSSPQLDVASRGFSFGNDGPLDMRMDQSQVLTAAQFVNTAGEPEIARVLNDYGEERYARRLAKAIVEHRETAQFETTLQLAEVVKAAHPRWDHQRHPATKTFQAIRIHVNNEIGVLQQTLEQAARLLAVGGRLVVISFHSLEDRLVKRAIRGPVNNSRVPRHLPLPEDSTPKIWRSLSKAIFASEDELQGNPRARSAVLRVAERVA